MSTKSAELIRVTEVLGVVPTYIAGTLAYIGVIALNSIYAQVILSAALSILFIFLSMKIGEELFQSLSPVRRLEINCPYAPVFFAQTHSTPFFGMKLSKPHRFVVVTNEGYNKATFMHECTHARFWYIESVNILITAFLPVVLGKFAMCFPGMYFAIFTPTALVALNEVLADRNYYFVPLLLLLLLEYPFFVHNTSMYVLFALFIAVPALIIMRDHHKVLHSRPV